MRSIKTAALARRRRASPYADPCSRPRPNKTLILLLIYSNILLSALVVGLYPKLIWVLSSIWSGLLAITALGLLAWYSQYLKSPASQSLKIEVQFQKLSLKKFWLIQGLFLLGSFFIFGLLAYQSQLQPRLQALPLAQFFQWLAEEPISLWLAPWILATFWGLVLAHSHYQQAKPAYMAAVLVPKRDSYFKELKYRAISFILNSSMGTSLMWSCMAVMLLLMEGGTQLFSFPSFLAHAQANSMLCLVLLALSWRSLSRFSGWLYRKVTASLGILLVFFVVIVGLLLVWLHMAAVLALPPANLSEISILKSPLVGQFDILVLKLRGKFLILAFFLLWLPWLGALICRLAYQRSVLEVLAVVLFWPLIMLVLMQFRLGPTDFNLLTLLFQSSWGQISMGLIGLALLYFMTRHIVTLDDLNHGLLPFDYVVRHRALQKFAVPMLRCIFLCLGSTLVLGWPLWLIFLGLFSLSILVIISLAMVDFVYKLAASSKLT